MIHIDRKVCEPLVTIFSSASPTRYNITVSIDKDMLSYMHDDALMKRLLGVIGRELSKNSLRNISRETVVML